MFIFISFEIDVLPVEYLLKSIGFQQLLVGQDMDIKINTCPIIKSPSFICACLNLSKFRFLNVNAGIVIGNLMTRKFLSSTKKQNISSVLFATKSYTQGQV